MAIRVGCTGWAYDDWKGAFYPRDASPSEYLERYAQVFDYTEVDSSFYGPPTAETARKWARSTPNGFLFSLKVPGEITHKKRLRNTKADLDEFLQGIQPLSAAGKLGPLVLQMPPSFVAPQDHGALEEFVQEWPAHFRLAVELRDPSWWTEQTYDLFRANKVALIWSVTQFGEAPPVATTDFVYVRFVGDRQLTKFDKVQRYLAPLIEKWVPRIVAPQDQEDAYVVVNNHFMGHAPATAQLALQALRLPRVDLSLAKRRRHQTGLGEF